MEHNCHDLYAHVSKVDSQLFSLMKILSICLKVVIEISEELFSKIAEEVQSLD